MTLAFVFPGQGSQSLGMLSELAEQFPQVQDTFAEASAALAYDLWELVSNGPIEDLNQTDKTQAAMLAAGIAVWRCWQATTDIKPAYFAGHSLGEYTALVAADSLDFVDAIKLVEQRGQFMQQAVPSGEGAMAAILGLDDDIVIELCAEASGKGVAEAVNFNSPGQLVISGSAEAINFAVDLAKEKGAKRALLLPVSVPSHCALMEPAAEQLTQSLSKLSVKLPSIPVIHNVTVMNSNNKVDIKNLLAQQLYKPVRWVETIQYLAENGVNTFIECGPGKVLTGLSKRIDKSVTSLSVFNPTTIEKAIQILGEKT